MQNRTFHPEPREAFNPAVWSRLSDYAATLLLGSSRDGAYTLDLGARRYLAEKELGALHHGHRDTAARLDAWHRELAGLREEIATLHLPRSGLARRREDRSLLEIRCRKIERLLQRWTRFHEQTQMLRQQLASWLLATHERAEPMMEERLAS